MKHEKNVAATLGAAFVLSVVLSGCNQPPVTKTESPPSVPPLITDFAADITFSTDQAKATGKVYGSDGRLRTEMLGASPAIIDPKSKKAWVLDSAGKYREIALDQPVPEPKPEQSVKVTENDEALPENPALRKGDTVVKVTRTPLFPPEFIHPALADALASPCTVQPATSCRKLGSEDVNGRKTHKWELRSTADTLVRHLWIDERLRIPIRRQHSESVFELTNIQEGPQDPARFQLPSGYTQAR